MLPQVRATLAAVSAVTDLIGTNPVRAYRHGSAPQGVQAPYVTWSIVGGAPDNCFEGASHDFFGVMVDCWSDTDSGVVALATAVRDAIEPVAHLNGYVANERDAETKRYRLSMQFDWFISR